MLCHGRLGGHVLSFERFGEREVSYRIAREHRGRGLATEALSQFLDQVQTRPLHARAAKDNTASVRVLQKCGFDIAGEDKGLSNARGEEVEESVLRLAPSPAESHRVRG